MRLDPAGTLGKGEVSAYWNENPGALQHTHAGLNLVEQRVRVDIETHAADIAVQDLRRRSEVDVAGRGVPGRLRSAERRDDADRISAHEHRERAGGIAEHE